MLRSHIKWLIPAALAFGGFGLNVQSASAQATYDTYEFTANYKTSVELQPFNESLGIVRATITGETADAPYGLNSFTSDTYGQIQPSDNPSIIKYKFNSDPGAFGLIGEPAFSDRYYGGANELFGKASDSAVIDLEKGTISGGGTITIDSGKGVFENATGKIDFTQEDKLAAPGEPSVGQATLKFSLRTPRAVPEPTSTTALVGIGVTGAGLLLRKHRRKTTSN
jgi:hypothetical protein